MHRFSFKAQVTQVGNGGSINIFFIIPIIFTIQDPIFEIHRMVSEIHDNVDQVLCVKHFVELEAKLSMRDLKFKFLNRSILVFPLNKDMIKPKERRFLKVEIPFLNEVLGLGIIKFLAFDTDDTLIIKVKFERNKAF